MRPSDTTATSLLASFDWDPLAELIDPSQRQYCCEGTEPFARYVLLLKARVEKVSSEKRRKTAIFEAKALLLERWWIARQYQERDHRDRISSGAFNDKPCIYGLFLEATAWLIDAEQGLAPPARLPEGSAQAIVEAVDPNRLYGIAIGERHDEDT